MPNFKKCPQGVQSGCKNLWQEFILLKFQSKLAAATSLFVGFLEVVVDLLHSPTKLYECDWIFSIVCPFTVDHFRAYLFKAHFKKHLISLVFSYHEDMTDDTLLLVIVWFYLIVLCVFFASINLLVSSWLCLSLSFYLSVVLIRHLSDMCSINNMDLTIWA